MRVPGNVVDGRGSIFPQGNFLGRIQKVEEKWSEDGKNLDYVVTFGDNTPLDAGAPNVGARPYIQRLTVVFQNESIVDIVEFTEKTPFALSRTAGLIAQLAVALGVATRSPDGSVDFNTEGFLESLAAGAYRDRQVGYEVKHRGWTSKKQKNADGSPVKGTSAETARFFNLEAQVEAEVPAETTLREARTRA